MNLYVLIGALLANISVGGLFTPYFGGAVSANVLFAGLFSKYKYKTRLILGWLFAIVVFVTVFAGIEYVYYVLKSQSEVYAYIICGVATFSCVQFGQVRRIITKIKKNTENATYLKQIFSKLLIKNSNIIEPSRYKKAYCETYARLFAERIITPALFLLIFGPGAAIAYIAINTIANTDYDDRITSHGFFDGAILLNKILSFVGYLFFALIIGTTKWIFGMKNEKGKQKIKNKAVMQLFSLTDSNLLDDKLIGLLNNLSFVMIFISVAAIIACFVFIENVAAAAGLSDYWDFWNGKDIVTNE